MEKWAFIVEKMVLEIVGLEKKAVFWMYQFPLLVNNSVGNYGPYEAHTLKHVQKWKTLSPSGLPSLVMFPIASREWVSTKVIFRTRAHVW